MNMKHSQLLVLAALLSTQAQATFAQNEISNNQPIARAMSDAEIRIQTKLKANYKSGLIDDTQLASFQRDFDGILVKEDNFKMRGLTSGGQKTIDKALAAFEARLDRASGLRTRTVGNTAGAKLDKNTALPSDIQENTKP